MNCRIDPLIRYPNLIPTLARWHDRTWRHLNPASYDLQQRIQDYNKAIGSDHIPLMLVAHDNGKPLGSARLTENDMDSHPELGPWLASLYVHPDYRRRGVATMLVSEIEQSASRLGFERLYLFTEDMDQLYRKLGWQQLFREPYYGETVTVMQKQL